MSQEIDTPSKIGCHDYANVCEIITKIVSQLENQVFTIIQTTVPRKNVFPRADKRLIFSAGLLVRI
jgi:hypothetical protein